jgi:two-component system, chemotaxis family, protein-glutamate methylesterase/glutaminase
MTVARAHDLVVVGASWGGLDAVREIVGALPAGFGAPVVVAQHRSPESHPTALKDILGAAAHLHVCEAEDKDQIRPGTLYVAAPDYHLLVEHDRLALSTDEPVQYARPSIDVLFASAAESFRERCIGVVLTGANADGAEGLRRVAELGGTAIVQDPDTSVRREMPRAAIAAVPEAQVLPVEAIGPRLVDLCGAGVAA